MKMVQSDQIGERIRLFALSKHLSIKDFADFIGMDPGNVQKYLKSKRKPGTPFLKKLQDDGCNITWLLTGEGQMYEEDEKASYVNAFEKAVKQRSSTVLNDQEVFYQYPPGPVTKALGKGMCIEGIQEGDDIFLDIDAYPKKGDLVLRLKNDVPTLERFKPGDPKPYAICNRLMRNLRQHAKPCPHSEK
jgi:transcriptional regulator with XRE-family HTH domain